MPPHLPWEMPRLQRGYVAPIKDEGQYAACWAFSVTGVLKGQQAKIHGKFDSLSEQNLIDCFQLLGNYGCNGGFMSNAYAYVKVYGLDTEESYP
ncbi:unnamed protein product [Rotaria sp. Silwood1]|nr:unnamed protein product [Rotaria sp. Silwood1]